MKYYISADLEGACGVTNPLQCYPKTDLTGYAAAVRQLAAEVNAVVETLFSVDPKAEVVVNDAHNAMVNFSTEHLSPRVRLLSGKPKLCAMMNGLDKTFDAVLFVGYHAKAGTECGVLNHTFHQKLSDVTINGISYGEGGINALYAGLVYHVPVILASGDRQFCEEISAILPETFIVETKVGITTTAALNHPVETLLQSYREQTRQAVETLRQQPVVAQEQWFLHLEAPYRLQLTFINTLACDVVMTSPLYKRVDGTSVECDAKTFDQLYRALQASYTMLSYTAYME